MGQEPKWVSSQLHQCLDESNAAEAQIESRAGARRGRSPMTARVGMPSLETAAFCWECGNEPLRSVGGCPGRFDDLHSQHCQTVFADSLPPVLSIWFLDIHFIRETPCRF